MYIELNILSFYLYKGIEKYYTVNDKNSISISVCISPSHQA